jgi:glutamyl/glutaminyl-tRNA synthetase
MMSRGEAPRYDGHCRNLSQEEIEEKLKNKTPYVIRLKMPEKEIIISDLIRGKVKFNTKLIGVLLLPRDCVIHCIILALLLMIMKCILVM